MKTYIEKPAKVERKWWIVDATDKVLGRLAVAIANRLSGRDKVTFTPHVDSGDFIVVINSEKVMVTGDKDEKKVYRKHTGYYGHLQEEKLGELRKRKPEEIITRAVKGMLPANKLRAKMMKRLRVFVGNEHSFQNQKPETLKIKGV